ncbi:MAG: aldo/keto reductase [Planctomycetia bacterium]|nr:aldo/keto reductase [Planctomycetia bacterium]
MKRRQFLGTTLAGIGAATGVSSQPFNLHAAQTDSKDPVAQVHLTPDIITTRIGLGTGVHGGNRQCNLTRMDRAKALDIIRYCYDCGIRFFDMADMYGTHGLVAEALADKPRDSYTLGTKIWCQRGGIPEPERPTADILIERFLKELKTDYIDLVQLHCIYNLEWVERMKYQFEPLEMLKKKGLIRAHGVSCHSLGAAKIAAEMPWVDVMHMRINTENQRMEGSWDENVSLINRAKANGKGIIAMKILGEGTIKTPEGRRASTAAVTRLRSVDTMIVGFEKREHVDEFLTNVRETLENG